MRRGDRFHEDLAELPALPGGKVATLATEYLICGLANDMGLIGGGESGWTANGVVHAQTPDPTSLAEVVNQAGRLTASSARRNQTPPRLRSVDLRLVKVWKWQRLGGDGGCVF